MRILPRLLRRVIHTGSLTLIGPDGTSETFGGTTPGPSVTIRITDPALDAKLLLNPELRFAEAYMDGGLEVAPEDLRELLRLFKLNKKQLNRSPSQAIARRAARVVKRIIRNTPFRASRNARAHYDIGNDLYRLFLDADMQYSCAYFPRGDETLEQAQLAKKRHIAAKLMLRPGQRVLDIGCGPGHTALLFATRAKEVVALDPTQAMLDQARVLATERGLDNLRFECASAEAIPFPNDSFDRVTSRQSAHHYPDVRAALSEVARVLRPGGRFVLIDTFSPEESDFDSFLNQIELLRDSSHVRDYRVSEWRDMFADVGMSLSDLQHWDIPLEFDNWVERSRTPASEVAELRRCFGDATAEERTCFRVKGCDWSVPIGLVVGESA